MTAVRRVSSPPDRPTLIFDGDCDFCRFWIERWRHRTGDAVSYEPSQNPDARRRFPEIPPDHSARAVQLIDVDGRVSEAAEAVSRLYAVGGQRLPLWAYEQLPGAKAAAERTYRLIADHRSAAAAATVLLWGRSAAPSTHARATWLFLRLLGIVYLVAFWSLGTQIRGLIGHDGILPADQYLDGARTIGGARFWLLPTLAWLNATDTALQALCVAGSALAVLLIVGVLSWAVLPALWLIYLSLSVVSRGFLSYQWDALLLETGFLAIFLAPLTRRERLRALVQPPRAAVALMLWLLFRLMVGSGAVKLTSGDAAWHSLTALAFHFETQPIPTPVAWYAHHLPAGLLTGSTLAVLAIEIGVPVLILAPRRVRAFAFIPLAALQLLIALTGNYAFFNLLALGLCLFLLDDAALGTWGQVVGRRGATRDLRQWISAGVATITVPVSVVAFASALGVAAPGALLIDPLVNLLEPFRSVNAYGLFAVMTTTRNEIVLEGTEDGSTWVEYEFKYKAGNTLRRPPWVAPQQPRLDWEMWFAALGQFEDEPWFQSFCVRLLDADRDVLSLIERDPFDGRKPRAIRAVLYRYQFSDSAQKRADGAWWTRERLREYSPVLSLDRKEDK